VDALLAHIVKGLSSPTLVFSPNLNDKKIQNIKVKKAPDQVGQIEKIKGIR